MNSCYRHYSYTIIWKSGAELISDSWFEATYYEYLCLDGLGILILILIGGTLCWTHAGPVYPLSSGNGGFSGFTLGSGGMI